MADPDEQKPHRPSSRRDALATTALGSSDDLGSGTPAPMIVQDGAEADTEDDPLIGRVLGGLYKVESQIGEGGMGKVYKALHIHLNKHFAIKVLSNKIASDKQAVERLRQEAVAASSIDHDNIVDVVSFDTTDDGHVFIVMELLKGTSLADVLERGRVPLPRAVHIGMQIAHALHAAHENGIVHRDLKPENIFIVRKRERDFVKVLDFGISKVKSADTEKVRMTRTGQLVGTPLYMSPEQARGEADVDRRVDVYALGVILYEMLTGAPPFEGGNYFQLLWKHGNEPPQPLAARAPEAEIPLSLEAVIMKALEKLPGDRYETMEQMEAALAAASEGVPTPDHLVSLPSIPTSGNTRTTSPTADVPSNNRTVLILVAAAILLAGVGVVIAIGQDDDPAPVVDVDSVPTAGADPAEGAATEGEGDEATSVAAEELPEGRSTPGEGEDEAVPTVVVTFASRPEGATVTVSGEELGETELMAPLPAGDEPLQVVFSLEGYLDDVVSVVPVEGARVVGRLRPRRSGRPRGGGPTPGIKTKF